MHKGRETQTLGHLLVCACQIHIKALTNLWVKPSLRILKSHTSGGKVCVEEPPVEYPSLTLRDLYLRVHQSSEVVKFHFTGSEMPQLLFQDSFGALKH